MKSSEIIFCENFKFSDGFQKDKYFIVLNDPQPHQNFLVALTTSQELYAGETKKRPSTPGCHVPDGCFFIVQKTEWFSVPTWICLDDFFEFDQQEALRLEQGSIFKRKSCLGAPKFMALISCVKMSNDISPDQINLLSNSVKISR